MVFIYKNNELCERMSLSEALSVNTSVISVVGAGGKTTLLHRLEDECVRKKTTCDHYDYNEDHA